jgi:hypothetical protein
MATESAAGGVQSVERSALLLDVLARAGGRAGGAGVWRIFTLIIVPMGRN